MEHHTLLSSNETIKMKIKEKLSENVLDKLYLMNCKQFNDHMLSLNWEDVCGKSYSQMITDGDITRKCE